jgi:anti-sigma regulatory factor (Ser/Thr protein kinase)
MADDVTDSFEVVIRNETGEMSKVTAALEAFGEKHELSPKDAYHFDLAFDEVLVNVISYAYEAPGEHQITVRMWIGGGRVTAEVIDDGKPYDPLTQAPEPDLDADIDDRRIGGLGVHLVKTFMDHVEYRRVDGRNHFRFGKELKK